MGPREVGGRAGRRGAPPAVALGAAATGAAGVTGARFTAVLPAGALAAVPPDAAKRLRRRGGPADGRARRVLRRGPRRHGRPGLVRTTRRPGAGPRRRYAFDVPYRDEDAVGDIKQIWEPSRHQYLTVLAAAYAVTGDERYAERVAAHLRSWWAANPPLRGVHWTSGIELGIRLLSWVWVRRLLDGWPGAAALFEDNPVALSQIWHHQRWLAAFPSRGSSANNHVVAEAAGQFAAACAFGWFPVLGALAGRRAAVAGAAAARQHLRLRAQPRAGHRVPRAGPGAGPGRGGRGGRRRACRCPRRSGWCCCG